MDTSDKEELISGFFVESEGDGIVSNSFVRLKKGIMFVVSKFGR